MDLIIKNLDNYKAVEDALKFELRRYEKFRDKKIDIRWLGSDVRHFDKERKITISVKEK